jgi:hypothetical protein
MSPPAQRRQRRDRRPTQPAVRSSWRVVSGHQQIRSLYRAVGVVWRANPNVDRWQVISRFLWLSERWHSNPALCLVAKWINRSTGQTNKSSPEQTCLEITLFKSRPCAAVTKHLQCSCRFITGEICRILQISKLRERYYKQVTQHCSFYNKYTEKFDSINLKYRMNVCM